MTTIRAFMKWKGGVIRHLDVLNAFLNGSVHEEVYMRQPDGYPQDDVIGV